MDLDVLLSDSATTNTTGNLKADLLNKFAEQGNTGVLTGGIQDEFPKEFQAGGSEISSSTDLKAGKAFKGTLHGYLPAVYKFDSDNTPKTKVLAVVKDENGKEHRVACLYYTKEQLKAKLLGKNVRGTSFRRSPTAPKKGDVVICVSVSYNFNGQEGQHLAFLR